jgi:hypothetical protein
MEVPGWNLGQVWARHLTLLVSLNPFLSAFLLHYIKKSPNIIVWVMSSPAAFNCIHWKKTSHHWPVMDTFLSIIFTKITHKCNHHTSLCPKTDKRELFRTICWKTFWTLRKYFDVLLPQTDRVIRSANLAWNPTSVTLCPVIPCLHNDPFHPTNFVLVTVALKLKSDQTTPGQSWMQHSHWHLSNITSENTKNKPAQPLLIPFSSFMSSMTM